MNRIEDYAALKNRINKWLVDYFDKTKMSCFVVGVSGVILAGPAGVPIG